MTAMTATACVLLPVGLMHVSTYGYIPCGDLGLMFFNCEPVSLRVAMAISVKTVDGLRCEIDLSGLA